MPGMMPPTLLPGYGMGHGMERELGPQMHRSQSMPSGSYPPGGARRAPHVHSGGRFDRDSATRNAPPLLGWKTGRNDPTLMHNEVLKMRLGRDRSEMEPRQAEQFINHVQQRGRSAPLAAPATARLLCLARTRLAALWTARHSDEEAEPLGGQASGAAAARASRLQSRRRSHRLWPFRCSSRGGLQSGWRRSSAARSSHGTTWAILTRSSLGATRTALTLTLTLALKP